ncbi:tryptophan synthase subunit alpha [Salirhabdus salicampi]|uniref:tryptophan synthase subunit alpha n=1 Tax=Salirhabdus salicampi TaxID=476102 RepID=UPI0020C204D8|nr:tryptophan synthase subunit alpha [Salirhabdus salicampi]MCP8617984.1 tryptophan synthase subunit alpha [Salirhabdus salicampi]
MSKQVLEQAFQQVEAAGEKAFVPYIMAGDGGLDSLLEKLQFLQESGATVVELGIPFSDPVADGPTIQDAGIRALKNGTTLRDVLQFLKDNKDNITVPIVLMTYLNPVYKYGIAAFAQDAKEAGVSGLIMPDLPIEQVDLVQAAVKENELALIQLVTLTSPVERIQKIAEQSEGFLYAVTIKGTTGARSQFHNNLEAHLNKIKQFSSVPVLAGFGISTPDHVKELGSKCDGVIVGSKIIDLWEKGQQAEIAALIQAAKEA